MITAEDYSYLAKFLSENSGLELGLDKGYLIRSRLEPLLTTFKLKNLGELVSQLRLRTDMRLVDSVVDADSAAGVDIVVGAIVGAENLTDLHLAAVVTR